MGKQLTRFPILMISWLTALRGRSGANWILLRFGPSLTLSHTYFPYDSLLSRPCTCISRLSSFWLTSLTTVYLYLTLIFFLTHFSHDCVLYPIPAPLWLTNPLSQKCIYRPRYLLQIPQLSLTQIYLSTWSSPSWNLCLDISIPLRYTFILCPNCL